MTPRGAGLIVVLLGLGTLLLLALDQLATAKLLFVIGPAHFTITSSVVVNTVTIVALIVTVYQVIQSQHQLRLFTETEHLATMRAVVHALTSALPHAKVEVLFMANVPAIGATGAPEVFEEFEREMVGAAGRLGAKFRVIYVDPATANPRDDLNQFYQTRGLDNESVRTLLDTSLRIDQSLRDAGARRHLKPYVRRIPLPHFLLIDPGTHDGKAVVWNLDKPESLTYGSINGVGFVTKNAAILLTHQHIFSDTMTDATIKDEGAQAPR